MAAKDELGRRGEDAAARYLTGLGWSVLERNWRCRWGELDLVARDGADLVFVEVKTRSGTSHGHPVEAIDAAKLRRLRRLAGAWLAAHAAHADGVRIDLLAVLARPGRPVEVEHLRGIG